MAQRRPDRFLGGPAHEEFWRWCSQGELRLQKCTRCDRFSWPVVSACEYCGHSQMLWEAMSGDGTLVSCCTFERDYYRGTLPIPWDTILVELREGPLFISNPVNFTWKQAKPGMPVKLTFARTPLARFSYLCLLHSIPRVGLMAKSRHLFDDAISARKQYTPPPHEFVLDAIAALSPSTRPMFGCLAVYVEDKIVLILRDKPTAKADNGVWLATTAEHHESLRREFPNMRSIKVLGKDPTNWQLLPSDSDDFEDAALRACKLVLARDLRIGKVPKRKVKAKGRRKKTTPAKRRV
jgi:uncharacterized OB-fold protein